MDNELSDIIDNLTESPLREPEEGPHNDSFVSVSSTETSFTPVDIKPEETDSTTCAAEKYDDEKETSHGINSTSPIEIAPAKNLNIAHVAEEKIDQLCESVKETYEVHEDQSTVNNENEASTDYAETPVKKEVLDAYNEETDEEEVQPVRRTRKITKTKKGKKTTKLKRKNLNFKPSRITDAVLTAAAKKKKEQAKKQQLKLGLEEKKLVRAAQRKCNPVSCEICNRVFSRIDHLNRHRSIHSGEKPHPCPECGKTFRRKEQLAHHMRKHAFKCDICSLSYSKEEYLYKHKFSKHFITCELCKKIFETKEELKEHYKEHEGEKPNMCQVCGKSFQFKKQLSNHMACHKSEDPNFQPFTCELCGQTCKTKKLFIRHQIGHTGRRDFTCEICGKAFKVKADLHKHNIIHYGKRTFQCPKCDKAFLQNRDLKRHLLNHSENRPFQCGICGKGFKNKHNYNMHAFTHLGQKPFQCQLCSKNFRSGKKLKEHQQTHEEYKDTEAIPDQGGYASLKISQQMAEKNLLNHNTMKSQPSAVPHAENTVQPAKPPPLQLANWNPTTGTMPPYSENIDATPQQQVLVGTDLQTQQAIYQYQAMGYDPQTIWNAIMNPRREGQEGDNQQASVSVIVPPALPQEAETLTQPIAQLGATVNMALTNPLVNAAGARHVFPPTDASPVKGTKKNKASRKTAKQETELEKPSLDESNESVHEVSIETFAPLEEITSLDEKPVIDDSGIETSSFQPASDDDAGDIPEDDYEDANDVKDIPEDDYEDANDVKDPSIVTPKKEKVEATPDDLENAPVKKRKVKSVTISDSEALKSPVIVRNQDSDIIEKIVFPLHPDKTKRIFQCPLCDQILSRSDKLTGHCKRKHSIEIEYQRITVSDKQKNQNCQYCDKSFARKDQLLRHMRRLHPDEMKPAKTRAKRKTRTRKRITDESLVSTDDECEIKKEKDEDQEKDKEEEQGIDNEGEEELNEEGQENIEPNQSAQNLTNKAERYVKELKTADGLFQCPFCEDTFPKLAELVKHCADEHDTCLSIRTGREKGKISKSDTDVIDDFGLKNRIDMKVSELKREDDNFLCPVCNTKISRIAHLVNHCATVHDTLLVLKTAKNKLGPRPAKKATCPICNKVFNRRDHMLRHKTIHTGEKRFSCELCGQTYVRKESLDKHLANHYPKCEICGLKFDNKVELHMHLLTHEGDNPNKCEICGKCFQLKHKLEKHMKYHEHDSSKDYFCHLCGESFRHKRYLDRHLVSHTGRRDFVCQDCGKSFKVRVDLTKHRIIHGAKNYNCTKCDKSFYQIRDLKRHLFNHSDLKPYSCETCGHSFKNKYNLKVHQLIHSNIKPNECKICSKNFRSTVKLKEHQAMVHGMVNPNDAAFALAPVTSNSTMVDPNTDNTHLPPQQTQTIVTLAPQTPVLPTVSHPVQTTTAALPQPHATQPMPIAVAAPKLEPIQQRPPSVQQLQPQDHVMSPPPAMDQQQEMIQRAQYVKAEAVNSLPVLPDPQQVQRLTEQVLRGAVALPQQQNDMNRIVPPRPTEQQFIKPEMHIPARHPSIDHPEVMMLQQQQQQIQQRHTETPVEMLMHHRHVVTTATPIPEVTTRGDHHMMLQRQSAPPTPDIAAVMMSQHRQAETPDLMQQRTTAATHMMVPRAAHDATAAVTTTTTPMAAAMHMFQGQAPESIPMLLSNIMANPASYFSAAFHTQ